MEESIKKVLPVALILSVLILVGCGSNKYDNFAKCLAEKNVKKYGAYWCPHCANQKDLF